MSDSMSENITKPWRVDRDHSPMDVIQNTGRRLYVSEEVVAAMPRGEGEEGETIFFRLDLFERGGYITDVDLDREYELRDLAPEFPDNLAAVNKADPAFADLHPNATHWRDADGTWCYAAFLRWYDARELFIDRSEKSWPHSYWWFAGRSKRGLLAV
jgi:hypothetical protein